jgi:hypothetical protein
MSADQAAIVVAVAGQNQKATLAFQTGFKRHPEIADVGSQTAWKRVRRAGFGKIRADPERTAAKMSLWLAAGGFYQMAEVEDMYGEPCWQGNQHHGSLDPSNRNAVDSSRFDESK